MTIYRPYPIDWRFLPEWTLRLKDRLRHECNKLGGSAEASTVARFWFRLVRASTISAIHRAGVLFIHIPRTGGTSICQNLYGQNIPHASLGFYRSLGIEQINVLPTFSVIRDPACRARSAYRFIREGGTDLIACSRFDPLQLAQCATFDEFADRIFNQPDMVENYDLLRPQVNFLSNPDRPIDRLFAYHRGLFEDPEFQRFVKIPPASHLNESCGQSVSVSSHARNIIETLYAEDVAMFQRIRSGERQV